VTEPGSSRSAEWAAFITATPGEKSRKDGQHTSALGSPSCHIPSEGERPYALAGGLDRNPILGSGLHPAGREVKVASTRANRTRCVMAKHNPDATGTGAWLEPDREMRRRLKGFRRPHPLPVILTPSRPRVGIPRGERCFTAARCAKSPAKRALSQERCLPRQAPQSSTTRPEPRRHARQRGHPGVRGFSRPTHNFYAAQVRNVLYHHTGLGRWRAIASSFAS